MLGTMHFVLDLLQGLGIAAAIGIRPFLPVLLAGILAAANAGLDFDGTGFAFLEQWWLWAIVLVVVLAIDVGIARRGADSPDLGPLEWALAATAVVLGALQAAGSVEDRGNPWIVGLIAGALAAGFAFAATRPLLARVRRRLDGQAAAALPFYGEGVALVAAGLSILFPPLAFVALIAFVLLIVRSRGEGAQKYEGLRSLR